MGGNIENFSIATFNVHMWYDGDYEENYDRVLRLVRVSSQIRHFGIHRYLGILVNREPTINRHYFSYTGP